MTEINFSAIFNPESVAVVGASEDEKKGGYRRFKPLVDNFKGRLYPVRPDKETVFGIKCYPRVIDIPEEVDQVIISIPIRSVPSIIEDCIEKKVKVVMVFTAGYSESGEVEGKKREEELLKMVRRGGIRIIGPNCIGVYCPQSGLAFSNGQSTEEGNVAFIAQSGGLAMKFSQFGTMYGINFSKVVSFGNGADIDFTDFLHYLAHDPHTDIITAYLEGIRDGSKFLEIVRDPTFRKPFIIWKAGKTKTGARAAASHTGSMAGDNTMWEAIFKQNGIVGVDSFEELLETLLLFRLAPESGPKVAIVTGGGGAGVSATDLCANVGLDVPELSPKTCKRLREFVPHSGTSVKNPVDMAANAMNVDANIKVIEIVAEDENVDTLMVLGTPEAVRAKDFTEGLIQNKNNFKKPVLPVMPIISGEMIDIHKTLSKHFPVFLSEESTARALANLITYQKKKILFPKNETK